MTVRPLDSPRRNSFGRIRANVDRLDHRTLLSGATVMVAAMAARESTLSIVATSPASSSIAAVAPSVISITFDRPIDPFSFGGADFNLEHLGNNGSTTPMGPLEPTLAETLDPSGTKILLTPSSPLAPGTYRLELSRSEMIQGQDGSALSLLGRSAKVADFRIGAMGVSLAGATDLGVPDSTISTVSGSLDFSANPDPVSLYKVEVPAGQFDRLGVEVSSTRDGGTLQTDLSLFDASGHRIATSIRGRPDFPFDPYLFAGVGSGTYYIGVSGVGDVPGSPGGYDPSSGLAGTSGQAQAGGKYRLHFVADAVGQPIQVLGVQVDHADPFSTLPTGLTIQFSGPLQAPSTSDTGQAPIELVGSNGQSWPVMVTQYDDSTAQLTLAFDQALPADSYSVVMTGPGSLVDLAGTAPVSPGEPQNVLGTVNVVAGSNAADDLGTLLPNLGTSGLTTTISIPAGVTVTKDVTVVAGGIYAIKGLEAQVQLGVRSLSSTASPLPIPAVNDLNNRDLKLAPGVYQLTFTNPGAVAVNDPITIDGKTVILESFVESGIGQGPGLSLRLVSPASLPSANSAATGIDPRPESVTGPTVTTVSGASWPAASTGDVYAPTVLNTNLPGFISVGTPVGRPTVQSQYLSVVGPAGNAEGAAISSNSDSLPGGSRPVPVSVSLGSLPRPVEVPSDQPALARTSPRLSTELALADARETGRGAAVVDELLLADASWLEQIVGWTMSKVDSSPDQSDQLIEDTSELVTVERSAPADSTTESGVEASSLASPLGLGVAIVVALRRRDRKSDIAENRRGPLARLGRAK